MTDTYQNWHKKFPLMLWGYRTFVKIDTRATPYSLVYGMETILPIVLKIPSLSILAECKVEESQWLKVRYEELPLIDEKRLEALNHIKGYQQWTAKAYDKKVRPRKIAEGDLVLKELRVPVFYP